MSITLSDDVFQYFDHTRDRKGNVIDLWAALHAMPLRCGAWIWCEHTNSVLSPSPGTGKRNG
jgi:hypothetical protein